jgi:DNA polymerase I
LIAQFRRIFSIDTEFRTAPGEPVSPVSLTAKELYSGEIFRFRLDKSRGSICPLPLGEDTLYVVFFGPAESCVWQSLGWGHPLNIIDLFVEQKLLDNNDSKGKKAKGSLLSVLIRRGLQAMDAVEKTEMRNLILGKTSYTDDEWMKILDYNLEDVVATERLFNDMQLLGQIDWGPALSRGNYSWCCGRIETVGIPLDEQMFKRLRANWDSIESSLISKVDMNYGVFEGRSFKQERFKKYLVEHRIPWPHSSNNRPILDKDTFKLMAQRFPQLENLRELRKTLGKMRLNSFPMGSDGRARAAVRPFASITGRNQPSTSEFIFGSAKWLRFLIQPKPGMALAYLDQSQQEFGIAAALSKDENMQGAYNSGDPYLEFAKLASAVPANATKNSHPRERDLYKSCVLAVQYEPTSILRTPDFVVNTKARGPNETKVHQGI